ncbi:hypothetical protein INH39_03920 [Massilia violaceinigra]|uniref:Uncharacterized protein n=1 Tax=Massilia violaceinigra TaxID=2045208 RepID=A0ABY4A7Y4_9BURK|nr:hypothetical protein [Massilia violaceinigra]UOD30891.1 hypothetical protein INH39_03920 [Massilia violaceinigra]
MTYCKLYIDDEMAIEELQRLADKGVELFFNSISADTMVFANENYLTKKGGNYSTHPIYISKYYVEIENEPGQDFEREWFVAGTAVLMPVAAASANATTSVSASPASGRR